MARGEMARERGMERRDCWERTRGGPGWAEDRRPPGGQERFLPRPQGEEAVVGEDRGRIQRDSVRRLDKSKSPHLSPGVYDVFGPLPVTMGSIPSRPR